jgi:hypothetical protein
MSSIDNPIMILPSLAERIGLNEAIILQYIQDQESQDFERERKVIDGNYWVNKSLSEWDSSFKFFSQSTIQRALRKLEKLNLLVVARFNNVDGRWYAVNKQEISRIENED